MAEESTRHPAPDLQDIYPDSGMKATPCLESVIREEIENNGPIPFSRFMELALYHPELGYYSSPQRKTGKQGDFITSVSIGPCLGIILARRLFQHWQTSGEPSHYHIIEPGAHDGSLAQDILNESKTLSAVFYQSVHYHTVETSALLRQHQKTKLSPCHQDRITTHQSLEEINVPAGAIISNELIDAIPVELMQFTHGRWQRQMITNSKDEGFDYINDETSLPDELQLFFDSLGNHYPEGYTTEYNAGIKEFTSLAGQAIQSGLMITIDYGHLRPDYYHPDRSTGTLQTYHQHQKAENPLLTPGKLDITAHVDFTRLQEEAEQSGFHSPWFGTQARYLTEHAREWLLEMEQTPNKADPELVRQFQTLIHPSMLGSRFSVLEMHK